MRSLINRGSLALASAALAAVPAFGFAQTVEPPIQFTDLAAYGLTAQAIAATILIPALALFAAWVGFRFVMRAFRGAK